VTARSTSAALLLARTPVASWKGDRQVTVTGISEDTRLLAPGDLFWGRRGGKADGNTAAAAAFAAGAAAVVVTDAAVYAELHPPAGRAAALLAGAQLLGPVASRFYGDPSSRLKVVGITGTNGKTTTAHLIAAITEAAGEPAGIIGTVGYRVGGETRPAPLTTPGAATFQKLLAEIADAGAAWAVCEVSSHALAQERVEGTSFHSILFTNLTRDHLDYHGTMESYFEAKARLFTDFPVSRHRVINVDDPAGARLAASSPEPLWTYGLSSAAKVFAREVRITRSGIAAEICSPSGIHHLASPFLGRPNLSNLLAAWAWGEGAGFPPGIVSTGIASLPGVPGRMESVDPASPFPVIVDFAHTPDALSGAIDTVRGLVPGRVIVVFGCGGDRDPGKRPQMGEIAASGADLIVVTSDNPRSEAPMSIIEGILKGIPSDKVRDGQVRVIPEREAAIRQAVELAAEGDVVLIAGKGHETYQILGERTVHFDDREAAARALRERVTP
jgi:UDP-N-acetylmuramoyl-L-alanyl-D-glutamate--2,6-diaminopimelate ligase